MARTKLFRLAQPGTIFTDPATGFTISGDEEKELPPRPGQALMARVRHGALIEVKRPPNKKQEQKPKTPSQMNKAELLAEIGQREGLQEKLAALAREQGKEKPEDVPNREIAALIIDYDNALQEGGN